MNDNTMPSVDMTPPATKEGEYPAWEDLNPNFLAGENYGEQGPHPEKTAKTAFDVKGAHALLNEMPDEDLKQIPIMPNGSRLEQGAVYIDLRVSQPSELMATGNMEAGGDNWYVPKTEVPYPIWNRLIGVANPARLDQADEGSR